jgi:hypothetical protein
MMSGQLQAPAAYTRDRAPDIHWVGGVGRKAGLNIPATELLCRPVRQLSTIPTELSLFARSNPGTARMLLATGVKVNAVFNCCV